jgi:putative nucleotidyltransferase with HDIG domain
VNRELLFKQLDQIKDLPTLPAVVQRLGQAIRDPNMDAIRLARILEDDPSISSKVLKVANSALYGGKEPIATVSHAIARMGMTAVHNIALSTSLFSAHRQRGETAFERKAFWQHCITTGIAATVLYDKTQNRLATRYRRDQLHLSGLLHDIGKIIFDQYLFPEFSLALKESAELRIPLFQIELNHLSADHAQVGAWLGEKWKLSAEMVEVIRWHHEPANATAPHQDLVMLCHVANYICNREKLGNSGDTVAPAFFPSIWKRLGFEVRDIAGIVDQVNAEASKSEVLLALA